MIIENRRINYFLISLILFFSSRFCLARGENNIIKNIISKKGKEVSYIEIFATKKILKNNVSLIKSDTFVDLKIKGAQAFKPGTFYDSEIPSIQKIGLYHSGNDLVVRIYSNFEKTELISSSKINISKNKITLEINNNIIKSNLVKPHSINLKNKEPIKNIAKNPSSSLLEKSLWKITLFTLISILIFLALITFQKFRSLKKRETYQDKIEIISNTSLGGRQRLSLITVNGEKLLIAINPNGVQLLSNFSSNFNSNDFSKRSLKPSFSSFLSKPYIPERKKIIKKENSPQEQSNKKTDGSFKTHCTDQAQQKIQYKIDDSGVHKDEKEDDENNFTNQKTIDDVTSMIRKKLKNIPRGL